MTINEYQIAALRTAPLGDDLLHGAMGVCTEAGEIMDVVKKKVFYGKEPDLVNLREEAGDLMWYLAVLARAAGMTLDDIAQLNIAKLRARYPVKFNEVQALNRNLEAERAALEGRVL